MNSSKNSLGWIEISGFSCHFNIGTTKEESGFPQKVVLDIALQCDTTTPAKSRSLTDTISFDSIAGETEKLLKSKKWILSEEVAEELCQHLLETFSQSLAAKVEVRKFSVPGAEFAGVSITRTKNAA